MRPQRACGRARVVAGEYCVCVWFIVACAMLLDSCGRGVWHAVGVSAWRVERVRVCVRWERVCRACIAREGAICSRVCECVVLWCGSVRVGVVWLPSGPRATRAAGEVRSARVGASLARARVCLARVCAWCASHAASVRVGCGPWLSGAERCGTWKCSVWLTVRGCAGAECACTRAARSLVWCRTRAEQKGRFVEKRSLKFYT